MKAMRILAVFFCAVAMLLVVTAGAAAKHGYTVQPKSLQLTLELPASNGYSASIETNGHRRVILKLAKGGFTAAYTALGKVTRKGIEADFGSFGHVSLRFRSRRLYHRNDPLSFLYSRCRGRRSVGERGTFGGSIRFVAEREYAQIHSHRAAGQVVRSYRRVCKSRFGPIAGASAGKPSEEALFLFAQAKADGVLRFLLGIRFPLLGFTIAVGGEKMKLGRVAVAKNQIVIDYFRAIRISRRGENPTSAKVKLAKPFAGSASYLKDGKTAAIWSGSLRTRLPGSGLVPLAGPEFEAEICRGATAGELDRCTDRLAESLALRYGSGSHSQPLALARLSSLR